MTEAEYEQLSLDADEATARGDKEAARKLLEHGLAHARENGDSAFEAFLQAEIRALDEDYVAALPHYDNALSARGDLPLFLRSRGATVELLGKHEEAMEWFGKALAVNPNDYDSLRGKAVALGNLGKYQEAIEWFEKALAVNPNDYHSLREKGAALGILGKHEEAIEWFDKGLTVNPNDYHSLREKGVALVNLAKNQEAIEWFDKALAVNPNDHDSLREKGVALGNFGKHQEAIGCFDKALALNLSDYDSLRYKGVALSKLGKNQEAIEWFDKALAVNPNDYDSLRGKGVALGSLGKHQKAMELFDQALAVNPNGYDSLREKGVALVNIGKYQEAIECFDKALAIEPNDYRSLRNKGIALGYLRKHQEAIECFDEALAINARDAHALRGKAFALHALGDSKAALRAIKGSLELDPDNAVARSLQAFLESPGSLGAEADREARRRQEEERQKEIQRAKLEAWEALTARSAHRIGNLTFGIRGALRELSFMELPAEAWEEVKSISECVERTEAILEEFKRFVAPLRLNLRPCDACELMHRAARRVGGELKRMSLECQFPPDKPTVVADAQLLQEAIEELLINAAKALNGHGTIKLCVARATELPARLLGRGDKREYVVLSVVDNGPGIKPEHADRIFEPFFSTTAGGTGLGLSIVRKTVEAQRGAIRETGMYGKGARFEIFLPMKGGDSDVQGSDSGR